MTDPTNPEDVLRQALRAHVERAPLPPVERAVPTIRTRVKRRRALTTATATLACAAVLAVGFGVARGEGLFDPDPAPPVVTPPTPTSTTQAPTITQRPTDAPTTDPEPSGPTSWATAVNPQCGVPLTLSSDRPEVEITRDPAEPIYTDGLSGSATLVNHGEQTFAGHTGHGVAIVLLRDDGTVLAYQDPAGQPTEGGYAEVYAGPGFTWTASPDAWAFIWCGTEGRGATDPSGTPLPETDRAFRAILLSNISVVDDQVVTQAQSRVTTVTFVEGGAVDMQGPPIAPGAVVAPMCGAPFPGEQPDTGLTVAVSGTPIRTTRAVDDDITDGRLTVTASRAVSEQTVFGRLAILKGGVVVGQEYLASDGLATFSSSPGGQVEAFLAAAFTSCSAPDVRLAPGAYTVVPALSTTTFRDGTLMDLAYAEPISITLH